MPLGIVTGKTGHGWGVLRGVRTRHGKKLQRQPRCNHVSAPPIHSAIQAAEHRPRTALRHGKFNPGPSKFVPSDAAPDRKEAGAEGVGCPA